MEDLRGTLVATLGALLTAVLLLVMATGIAVLVLPRFGLEVRTVLSDSMEPRLSEGDLLVTWPVRASRIEPGDVILFEDGGDHAVAHRVVSVSGEPGARLFETKGDANDASDARLVPESDVRGRMIFYVPGAGTLAEHLRAPYGSLALIVIPCLALLALDGRSWLRRPARPEASPPPNGSMPNTPTPATIDPVGASAPTPAWQRIVAATAVTGIAIAVVGTAAILLASADHDSGASAPQIASVADASAIILQSRIEAIARDPSLAAAPDDHLAAALDALRPRASIDLSTLAVIDARGDVVASTGAALATTTDSGALLRALATNAPSSLPMRTVEGLPYVDVAAPIVDASGDTTGVLLARVGASTLWRDAVAAASDGHAAIVDADGAFFVAPSASDTSLKAGVSGCATAPLALDGAASAWSVISCSRDDAYPFDARGLALLAVALAAVAASAFTFAWIFDALPRAIALSTNDAASERLLMLRDHANEV
ncbi:MAG TPA: signal peptidase I [Dehalococcoidia bacterium]|jgi:signal peptidase|nr:signal peptidase I [Dehalococcoidia bacterium]